MTNNHQRLGRFLLTGIFVTSIHVAIAYFLIHNLYLSPPLANGFAFISATFISAIINSKWSFSSQLNSKVLYKFFLVSLMGFLISTIIAWVSQILGYNYLLGIIFVAIVVPVLSFALHNFWTFRL